LRLHGLDDAGEPRRPASPSREDGGSGREDLPYSVEVWAPAGGYVQRLAAVAAHPGIAFGAYYAAAREFPGRDITIRHNGRLLSRWTTRPG